MITCGLDVCFLSHRKYSISHRKQGAGHLRSPNPVPRNKNQRNQFIEDLEEHGCYIDKITPIRVAWTHEDVTKELLRILFPQVFRYLDSHRQQSGSQVQQPDWQLLTQAGGEYVLCEAARPTGMALHRNKGRDKAGIAGSCLWFGK